MVTLLDLESFNELDAQAFYLGRRRRELEATADVMLVVEDTCLPAHSQVLQLHSDLFSAMAVDVGGKRRRDGDESEELVLEAPFAGYSVLEVSVFLRLLYDPSWWQAVPDTLGVVSDSLHALLRLAHQFDTPSLLAAISSYMAGTTIPISFSQLCLWIKAAGACHLQELRHSLLTRLARRLTAGRQPLLDGLALLSDLEGLDSSTLRQLVAVITASDTVNDAALVAASEAAGRSGVYEWALMRWSQQPKQHGQSVDSPTFQLLGHEWHLAVFTGGHDTAHGYLTVGLQCKTPGLRADFKIAILNQDYVVQDERTGGTHTILPNLAFTNRGALGSLQGYGLLEGDCLRLRVTITLLPDGVAA